MFALTGSGRPTFSIEYELNPTSAGVCVNCSFLDSNTSECAAVVHQRISQLSSSGLMNIESSHKFTRSGDTAYGCIERVDLEQYQVGVIGGITKDQTTENEGMLMAINCIHLKLRNSHIMCCIMLFPLILLVQYQSHLHRNGFLLVRMMNCELFMEGVIIMMLIYAVTVVISLLVVVIISITVILLFIILNKTKRREKRRFVPYSLLNFLIKLSSHYFYTFSFLNRQPEDTLSLVSDGFPLSILCIHIMFATP